LLFCEEKAITAFIPRKNGLGELINELYHLYGSVKNYKACENIEHGDFEFLQ
jgi:hypothetical protein